jgi:hypothetical protein
MSDSGLELEEASFDLRLRQRRWAEKRGLLFDDRDRVDRLEDNLLQPLNPATQAEYEAGDGSELGTTEAPGSMYSLISSSALCCNMFDAWRGEPLADLAIAIGVDPSYAVARFEAKYPTGLGGIAPNLDVELEAPGLKPVAIESKFTETYRRVGNAFRPSYFTDRASWDGLESWRAAAIAIDRGDLIFVTFNAAQLIKHVLGLARRYGPAGFVLLYLWYRVPGPAGDSHGAEIESFRSALADEVDFRTATHAEAISSVKSGPAGWLDYVSGRYGLDGAASGSSS